jgi:hypothetical protein
MKKQTLILLAIAGVGGYLIWKQSKKPKYTISVPPPEKITEAEFRSPGTITKVATLVKKIAPVVKKLTKKQKKVATQAASYLSKNIINPQIGSFPDMC